MTPTERDLTARLFVTELELKNERARRLRETSLKIRYLDNARALHGLILALGHDLPPELEIRRQVRYP